jgi:hypothetical protein
MLHVVALPESSFILTFVRLVRMGGSFITCAEITAMANWVSREKKVVSSSSGVCLLLRPVLILFAALRVPHNYATQVGNY